MIFTWTCKIFSHNIPPYLLSQWCSFPKTTWQKLVLLIQIPLHWSLLLIL